jgi:cytochrome c biogenesis protein CcmG, thiol:disulfide interchange protein DsbE
MIALRRAMTLLPLASALALAALFFYGLRPERNPQELKSVFIGKPAPQFDLPALGGGRLSTASLAQNRVVVINFFASWCVPCRAEHAQLMSLSKQYGIPVYGIAWRDTPENAAAFLAELGNPYAAVGIDQSGRMGVDWGVAGVPESFVLNAKGLIGFRHWGDIRPEHVEQKLLPMIRTLEAKK